ncbi:MAG TPA: pirin family protein [Acidimicrobiales bacterium]|jgi:hypothetical protein|nr:pirin family protein [Acidimicrobiales bacterium]
MTGQVDIRKAPSRPHTQIDWLDSWHSFSFANHYDPANTHHGLLLVHNDDTVAAASGFGMHPHRDMEIVSWVLSGHLEHRDSEGNHGDIYPGLAQRMSAGTGIFHSEMNPSPDEPVHFLQMWVPPDTKGIPPGYEQVDVSAQLASGAFVSVASGRDGDSAIRIHQHDATMYAAQLPSHASAYLPDAPHVHLFVATGTVALEDAAELGAGDAARLTAAGARRVTAGDDGAHVVVWATA